ncbi:MAG: ABC transporter permease [Candidatus Puniceispirillales bacterium]|jgi:spermidine/putrescine transport system permease protein|tara:strand:+ start:7596 stop:8366 length:771 start_codon:yes stop_codon:yes gene_type:complete
MKFGKLYLFLIFGFLYIPIIVLITLSFNKSGVPTSWGGFSLEWYLKLFENKKILNALINTLIVATISTLLASIIGTLLAVGIELKKNKNHFIEGTVFVPMIIPDIVMAISLLSFFTLLQFTLGLYSIIISHVVFNIAFVCAIVRTRFNHFDHNIIEASYDLGAKNITTFIKITLPVIFPGVLAGSLLAFTLSIDEFIIAFFTAGPGSDSTTLPMLIYSMIRFGVTPEINALSTFIILFSFLILFISQRFNKGNVIL